MKKHDLGKALARRREVWALAACVAAFVGASFASGARADDALPDPRKPGPYPVGVTTVTYIDPSRTDPNTEGPRTLLTEIWYPAEEDARNLPKNKLWDFSLRGQVPMMVAAPKLAFGVDIQKLDETFKNLSVRDARIRDGKWPLIVFSHGNGGIRNQSTWWCDHMASHGYIVVSPDHTGNSAYTAVDGKLIRMNAEYRTQAGVDRPKDVSFLIDMMTKANNGADSRFTGRVELDRVGVAGHSFGGYTAIHVINTDTRIKAIIPMTPVWRERTNYTTPSLMILATEDRTIGLDGNANGRKYFEESKGPHYMLEIKRGGHYTPTDMYQFNPAFGDGVGHGKKITEADAEIDYIGMDRAYEIMNAYSVAFFGVYVKGQQAYGGFLEKNHYGDDIDWKHEVPATAPAAAGSN